MRKRPFDKGAGQWVALEERPHPTKPGERVTYYMWRTPGTWTTDIKDAARFDTFKEAREAVAGPRTPGYKRGATKVTP